MASRTALKIARVIVQAGSDPVLSHLLPPGAAETNARILTACGLLPGWMRALLARPGFRRLARDLERSVSPGVTLHFVLRKRFVDDQVRAALADGASRCVVLGAGFDGLSLRLSREFPDRLFVDVDHPATMARKRSGIDRLGGPPQNLRLLQADLGLVPLPEALATVGHPVPGERSVFVAEGLLMYLTPEQVDGLLTSIASVAGAGSRVLFTYLEPDARGRPQIGRGSWITRVSLSIIGEAFRWAIRRGDLEAHLETLGFALTSALRADDLRRRYLEPAGLGDLALLDVEGLALAERSAS